jgi:hypothetical protein
VGRVKEIAWFSRGMWSGMSMKLLVVTALSLGPLGLAMMLVGRDLARNQGYPIRRHSEGIESWQRRLKGWLLRKRVGVSMVTFGGLVWLGLSTLLLAAAGLFGQFGDH